MTEGSIERAVRLGSAMLLPLSEALESAETIEELLAELGWELPSPVSAIGIDPAHVDAVADSLEDVLALRDSQPDDTTIAATYAILAANLAVLAQEVYDLRTTIAANVDAALLAGSDIAQLLPKRLFDYLLIEYVRERAEPAYWALVALGIFELEDVPRDPGTFTSEHTRQTIHLHRLKMLVDDPVNLFEDVYGWGTPGADLSLLLERLHEVGESLGLAVAFVYPPIEEQIALNPPGSVVDEGEATEPKLQLPLVRTHTDGTSAELGVSLAPLAAEAPGGAPGLALSPFTAGKLDQWFPIDRFALWLLRVLATLDLEIGVAVIARPGKPLELVGDPVGGGTSVTGALSIEFRREADPDEEIVILGTADGSGIRARGVFARAGVLLVKEKPTFVIELGAEQGRAGVSLAGSDSFIASVLPSQIPDINFDLGATWTAKDGLSFRGGAGLRVILGAVASLGPISLDRIYLDISLDEGGVALGVGVAAGVHLGPMTASVDEVGIKSVVTMKSGGNLGPLDIGVGFKPPKGVGLAVDAVAVKGGGFLAFDHAKGEYAGVLELSIKDQIQVKAIGLLNTKLPGSQKGFSLILIITAQFPPIQLSFGFVLTGVGGLIGVNRTMVIEVLRAGIRNRTLDSILFPENPVQNATKIISDLKSVFPPVEGRFVLGPMIELGWGTPPLVRGRLGVLIELPDPVRIALLGQLKLLLPSEEAPVARINLDALGLVELERSAASLDATIYDSEIATFPLTGDMAMRMTWAGRPNFALALGGLNPRFTPPPGFPELRRLTLEISKGPNPRLTLQAYLAATSNSVQFGARVQLHAEAKGFIVRGEAGFDALFVLSPFSVLADFAAQVEVLRGSKRLMVVRLDAILTGPRPWRSRGEATFKALGATVTVAFDVSVGPAGQITLPQANAKGPLLAALEDPRNWSASLPPEAERGATLGPGTVAPGFVLVHPFGRLAVRQTVAPLNLPIQRFGSATVTGPRLFRIIGAKLNGSPATPTATRDWFAPAQFLELSDSEKLSRPSYEPMDAGVELGKPGGLAHGVKESLDLDYETQIVESPIEPATSLGLYQPDAEVFMALAGQGAAAMSPARLTGDRKYVEPATTSPIANLDERHVITSADDLAARTDLLPAAGATLLAAEVALADHLAANPGDAGSLQVVPAHEAVPA